MGSPARNYKWADFAPGHMLSLKTGTYSSRAIANVVEQLHPLLVEPLEDCARISDLDAAEVHDWVTRESLLVMLTNELARRLHEHDGHFTDSDQWLLTRINSMMNRAQASRDRY